MKSDNIHTHIETKVLIGSSIEIIEDQANRLCRETDMTTVEVLSVGGITEIRKGVYVMPIVIRKTTAMQTFPRQCR